MNQRGIAHIANRQLIKDNGSTFALQEEKKLDYVQQPPDQFFPPIQNEQFLPQDMYKKSGDSKNAIEDKMCKK